MGNTNLTVVGFPILQALQSIVKSSYIKGLFYTVISYFSSTLNEINKLISPYVTFKVLVIICLDSNLQKLVSYSTT